MKKHHKHYIALPLALLFLTGCGGRGAGVAVSPGEPPEAAAAGRGPHTAQSVMEPWRTDPAASSGWLELFLDDASKTVSIRSHSEVEWSSLPRSGGTPKANAGACAVEADLYVGGHKLTLNSQDHAVAFGNAASQATKGADGKADGVEVAYTLTPDAATAGRALTNELTADDIAFLVRVRYTLHEGNLRVQADWENRSGNPNAFIAELGLMERFGGLRSPGPNDFILLPDGCGALLYPAREAQGHTDDLRFAVYGGDPSIPGAVDALRANVAAWGVRGQGAGFVAVVEQGAAQCEIVARQSIPGEIPYSAVGPRFTVTPVALRADGTVSRRAPKSYGGAGGEAFSIIYRFFNGDSANFNTMAISCREQLIGIGVLSSTKYVRDETGLLPLALTLLGTGPGRLGQKNLTTYEQAQDILTRMKSKGVNSVNVRYQSALSGGWLQKAPERLSPLLRLGGAKPLEDLQEYCKSKGLTLFLDARMYSARGLLGSGAETLEGKALRAAPRGYPWETGGRTLPLRAASGYTHASRAILNRVGKLNVGGVALGGVGSRLYADYSGGGATRGEALERLGRLLPSIAARWSVMLDTGDFYAVRHADVVVNLPLDTQLQMPGGRYAAVPLLPILLHGYADYAGTPLNLIGPEARDIALLRSIAYGACPAFIWAAAGGDPRLAFEPQLDDAMDAYAQANAALGNLRAMRITEYSVDPATGISITRYSNDAAVYVNYSDIEKSIGDITIPAKSFLRLG